MDAIRGESPQRKVPDSPTTMHDAMEYNIAESRVVDSQNFPQHHIDRASGEFPILCDDIIRAMPQPMDETQGLLW